MDEKLPNKTNFESNGVLLHRKRLSGSNNSEHTAHASTIQEIDTCDLFEQYVAKSTTCDNRQNDQHSSQLSEYDTREFMAIIDQFDTANESSPKRTKSTSDTIDFRVAQLFKTSDYQQEISQLFDHFEHTIHPDEAINGTHSLDLFAEQLNNGANNVGDAIKSALMQNAAKTIEHHGLVNKTLIMSNNVTFKSHGPFYNLPEKVRDLIKTYKGIDDLYDWQHECLQMPAIQQRKNLVYALPTSGGKTLVAEILILRELLCRRRNAIFVLPYVAIVQEKVGAMAPFAVALDFLVEEYAAGKGPLPPRKRRYKNSVYVATIEKALAVVNSLVEAGRLDELGLVVVDELHLIGEERRGATLEILLTKLMYLNVDIHIVGMSATIGNLHEIGEFLHAEVYTGNFRPVELTEYVKSGDHIAKIDLNAEETFEIVRKPTFSYSGELLKMDPDRLGGLVMEVVPSASCLVFCSTKKSCENVAQLLCRVVSPKLRGYKCDEKKSLKLAIKEESPTVCAILQKSIEFGVAYHHSGLTAEERRLIEESFRSGILSVICCTSTLAAGVNLPAKRVIIRKPYVGQDFLTLSRYKQMVGRAGRAGFGEIGESILICTEPELDRVRALLRSPMNRAHSTLHQEDATGLRNLFLSCIGLGIAVTRRQLHRVAAATLLAAQQSQLDVELKRLSDAAIRELFVMGALDTPTATGCDPKSGEKSNRMNIQSDSTLNVSQLGAAAIKGGLDLSKAHYLYDDLVQAQSSLVLINCLHLLYLVTPYDVAEQIRPSTSIYYDLIMKLGEKEAKTAKVLAIDELCATRLYRNQPITSVPERVLNRFYVALILYDLWNAMPIGRVASKYEIDRGLVQNLMNAAASFASGAARFCEQLTDFWPFAGLFKHMSEKLASCCLGEMALLMELPTVKQGRAKQLHKAGFKTLQSIAKADATTLIAAIQFMSQRGANHLIAAAQLLLLEKVETHRDEAEDALI